MSANMLFDSFHRGLGHVLDLRSQQHAMTASNLANADTPDYKARHIAFDRVLGEVMDAGSSLPMQRLSARHMPGTAGDPDRPNIVEMEAPAWSLDGNSVQLEQETVRLTENAMMYGAVTRGMSKRMAMMRYAASNGRG